MLAMVLLAVLAFPLPWRFVMTDPLGLALRLDGRLKVDGNTVDPPGRWSWLVAVGRPQVVGEVLHERVFGTSGPLLDVWSGSAVRQPALSEPAAAAVGLRHAGQRIPLGLLVEARGPLLDGYPEVAVIVSVDGIGLTDRKAWERASNGWEARTGLPTDAESGAPMAKSVAGMVTFRLADGREFTAPGPELPYAVVRVLDLAPPELEARISFRLTELLAWDGLRSLSLGRSHGMMIALATYAQVSDVDLAQGRHIAGTGGVRGDGTITRIGNLTAKAKAANRVGADVLLVPASQAHLLDDMAPPRHHGRARGVAAAGDPLAGRPHHVNRETTSERSHRSTGRTNSRQ